MIDLCTGIDGLAYWVQQRSKWRGRMELAYVEINPRFVEIGRKPLPEPRWIRTEVPHLKIVDDELWQAVKDRQQVTASKFEAVTIGIRNARARRLHTMKRPRSPFCLACSPAAAVADAMACSRKSAMPASAISAAVPATMTGRIVQERIEERVLAGLKERLVSADAVAEAMKAYAQETNRLNQERRAQSEWDRKTLDKIERAIADIMAAINHGLYQPTMKARMEDLERQKAEITARLAQAPSDVPDLHPNIANL